MAKLHSYHVLCPLIDQKSFLGVSQDKQEDYVIVTLSRNVVNKYRLSDQKQVGGWTSKDHITSAVVYDKENSSYVGIFNNQMIKMWKDDAENLDKLKKFKFPVNILKIIPRTDKSSLVIFSNGNCASLPYALDNRKTYESKSFLKESDTITDTSVYTINGTDHISYVINSKGGYEIITCPIREELGDLERAKLLRVKIARSDNSTVNVVGVLICTIEKYLSVFVLWNDSKMTVYNLQNKSWKTIGTVPWISTLSNISMAWMGKKHLVLIGSNTEQDGAIMIAYNVSLGVGSCKYPMKIYSIGAKLYCFNNKIILEAPNHIGMLPYILETKRNLSNLLGSHEIVQEEKTELATWDTSMEPQINIPNEIKQHFELGFTERTICSLVIPTLFEKDNALKIKTLLKEFKDVPEMVLVQTINYVVKGIKCDTDITNHDEFKMFCSEKELSNDQHLSLLNYIFEINFSDALLISYLRNGLTLDNALFLLTYISYLLQDSEINITADYERKLLDWCSLLMDSFYQHYLMTQDVKVSYVLQNTLNMVVNLVKQINVIDNTMSKLNKFLSGNNVTSEETLSYSIEIMQI